MNQIFKLTFGLAVAGTSLALLACSDNGTSSKLDLDDSFQIVLEKSNYSYNSKDSTLVFKHPECKESSLGYLVWNEETEDPDTLIAYRKDSYAYLKKSKKDDFKRLGFEGKKFPVGTLFDVDEAKESIRNAVEFSKKQKQDVFQYTGSCFMKSYYSQMFENDVMEDADKALVEFYSMFQTDKDYEPDEEKIANDFRAPDCDELTLFSGDVSVKIDHFKKSSGKIVLSYGKNSCDIDFNIRYAIDENDCKAAYDEFKLDGDADDEFDFDDYGMTVDFSYVCISRLVLQFQEDKGILKKSAPFTERDGRNVARKAVNVLLAGMKK